jgi:hypothetical protein
MGVNIHVDLETLQLIQGPGQRSAVAALRFKRGDAARLQVVFLENGLTPATIGNPNALEIQIGIKPRNQFDRSYLTQSVAWSMPSEGDDTPIYGCALSFNTLQLNSALNIDSPTAEELAEITLMGEITWREGSGEPTSTRTFLVVVENDVNRGTEGVPINADPAYPAPQNIALANLVVRHDIAQLLGLPAKLQARQNIGADDYVTKPLLLTASPVKDSAVSISNVTLYAAGTASPLPNQDTGVLHLVSVDPDGRRIYTSGGYIEPTGYRFERNLPGEMSTLYHLPSLDGADFDSYEDFESWIWPVGVTATVNEAPEASTVGQFAIVNGTDLFVATSLNPTTWEPVKPPLPKKQLEIEHSYGADSIVAPYSATRTPQTYSLPGRTGTLALNDGVGLGRSGTSNLILGKVTGISGSSNTGVGVSALSLVSGGGFNTAVGAASLQNCTSGMSNSAFGMEALNALITVGQNSAFGNGALRYVTVGVGNTGIGFRAGHANVPGEQESVTYGKQNTLLGNSAGVNFSGRSQSIAIGYRATTKADGELAIGAATAAIKGGTTGVTYNATNHGITHTVTAPANPSTPVGWLDARINGTLFKIPLYQ